MGSLFGPYEEVRTCCSVVVGELSWVLSSFRRHLQCSRPLAGVVRMFVATVQERAAVGCRQSSIAPRQAE